MQKKNDSISLTIFLFLSITILEADFIRDDIKEIVIDTSTNLIWQDNSDTLTITKIWVDAITYCEELELGGFTNWHLPNSNELFMLADRTRDNSSIDPIFRNTSINNYWSSTTDPNTTTTEAWIVYFGSAQDLPWPKTNNYHIRCVHLADWEF